MNNSFEPVAWAVKVVGGRKWLSIHASKGASDRWLEYRVKEQAQGEKYEQHALYTTPPAAPVQEPVWFPIDEVKPIKRQMVLVWYKGFAYPDTAVWLGKKGWAMDPELASPYWDEVQNPITHWMPLPQGPDSRTTSPAAQRQPLTDEQIVRCWGEAEGTRHGYAAFARAIEAAHGIKGEKK